MRNGDHPYPPGPVMAHNLLHELQMQAKPQCNGTTPSRAAPWEFERPQTFRARWLARAGLLTRPANRLTLTVTLVGGREAKRFLEMFKALGSRRRAA